jgi:hypothetical protein
MLTTAVFSCLALMLDGNRNSQRTKLVENPPKSEIATQRLTAGKGRGRPRKIIKKVK